jgi:hypothetical protein
MGTSEVMALPRSAWRTRIMVAAGSAEGSQDNRTAANNALRTWMGITIVLLH